MSDELNCQIENVLLVDDDANIRLIVKFALEKQSNWSVRVAESGEAALAQLESFEPDLILLDVMMPDVDGPMLLETIRARFKGSIPVIFLTAKIQNQEIHRYKNLGAQGLITKPFDPMTLVQQIKNILGRRSL